MMDVPKAKTLLPYNAIKGQLELPDFFQDSKQPFSQYKGTGSLPFTKANAAIGSERYLAIHLRGANIIEFSLISHSRWCAKTCLFAFISGSDRTEPKCLWPFTAEDRRFLFLFPTGFKIVFFTDPSIRLDSLSAWAQYWTKRPCGWGTDTACRQKLKYSSSMDLALRVSDAEWQHWVHNPLQRVRAIGTKVTMMQFNNCVIITRLCEKNHFPQRVTGRINCQSGRIDTGPATSPFSPSRRVFSKHARLPQKLCLQNRQASSLATTSYSKPCSFVNIKNSCLWERTPAATPLFLLHQIAFFPGCPREKTESKYMHRFGSFASMWTTVMIMICSCECLLRFCRCCFGVLVLATLHSRSQMGTEVASAQHTLVR